MNFIKFILIFSIIIFSFLFGRWTYKIEKSNINVELCKTVCVEEFEKMAC